MTSEQIKQFRKEYKEVLKNEQYWERQRREHPRKYIKEYYYASGAEWALHDMAQTLGIKLYDENFKLIEG